MDPNITLERIDDNAGDSPSQNFVGTGGMVCEVCNIALVSKSQYIASQVCPRCGGALKLRSKL